MDDYLARFTREVIPMIAGSAYVMNIAPGEEPDAKVCLEVGAAILLGKPLFIVLPPGRSISEQLRRAADVVIEADPGTEEGRLELMRQVAAFTEAHPE